MTLLLPAVILATLVSSIYIIVQNKPDLHVHIHRNNDGTLGLSKGLCGIENLNSTTNVNIVTCPACLEIAKDSDQPNRIDGQKNNSTNKFFLPSLPSIADKVA